MNLENLTLRELVGLSKMIDAMRQQRALDAPFRWRGSIEHLAESDIAAIENMYAFLHSQHTNIEQNYGSLENEPVENLIGKENMNKFMHEQYAVSGGNESGIKGNYESEILDGSISSTEAMVAAQRAEHAISGGNDSSIRGNRESEDLDFAARERSHRMEAYNSTPGRYDGGIGGSYDDMSTAEHDQLAASNKAVNLGQNNHAGRYDSGIGGTLEDMSTSELDQLAASNKAVNLGQNNRAGRYDGGIGGTMEDAIASGDGLSHLEAARTSQIAESRPHVITLQALLQNPHSFDADSFRMVVSQGLKNNQMLMEFMNHFRERLAEQIELIANTPKTPEELISRNAQMKNKFLNDPASASSLTTEGVRMHAKSVVEAYLNIYAHLRHEVIEQNGVIDPSYINISDDMISRIFDAQKQLGREKLSQLIMMPTPLKKHSQYNLGDFISPAVAALYSLDSGMRKAGAGLDIKNYVYKNPKSPRWQEPQMEDEGM